MPAAEKQGRCSITSRVRHTLAGALLHVVLTRGPGCHHLSWRLGRTALGSRRGSGRPGTDLPTLRPAHRLLECVRGPSPWQGSFSHVTLCPGNVDGETRRWESQRIAQGCSCVRDAGGSREGPPGTAVTAPPPTDPAWAAHSYSAPTLGPLPQGPLGSWAPPPRGEALWQVALLKPESILY